MNRDRHRVSLAVGELSWTFPKLSDPRDIAMIHGLLSDANAVLADVGTKLGMPPDAHWPQGIPMFQLQFYRLGPEPLYTKTDLISEGMSQDLSVLVHLRSEPQQPWQVDAWLDLVCEIDPDICRDHELTQWSAPPADTPVTAAQHLHTAALWVHAFVTGNPIPSLRLADPHRRHKPLPRGQHD